MEIRKVVLALVAVVSFGCGWFARGWTKTAAPGVVRVHLVDFEPSPPDASYKLPPRRSFAEAQKDWQHTFDAANPPTSRKSSRVASPSATASSHP
jgi:hypothetical protein